MKFKSFAQWPKGTVPHSNDVTDDTHDTREQAQGVCDLLRKNGFGGDHQVFPLKTWVEPVAPVRSVRSTIALLSILAATLPPGRRE